MPAFGAVRSGPFSDREIRAVVAFLNQQAGRASPTLLAARGEELYLHSCVDCHGTSGDRIPIAPLDSQGYLDSRTDAQMEMAIVAGRGAMPGLSSDAEARDATALVSYLRYGALLATVRSVSRARDLYVDSCLPCHGTSGNAVPGVGLADAPFVTSLGDAAVISAIRDGTARGPAFGAANGGDFTVADTAALLAYLKSWAGLNATGAPAIVQPGSTGEALYRDDCAPCHGHSGDQVPRVYLRSPAFLSSTTRGGVTLAIKAADHEGTVAFGTST